VATYELLLFYVFFSDMPSVLKEAYTQRHVGKLRKAIIIELREVQRFCQRSWFLPEILVSAS
jgi:hypothetical protein